MVYIQGKKWIRNYLMGNYLMSNYLRMEFCRPE